MWYICDVLYAVLNVCVSCFVVCGCSVSRRYMDVCNCDIFSVVNVYHDHLKFCVVCINSRMYVCCGECYVVSNECDEPTSTRVPNTTLQQTSSPDITTVSNTLYNRTSWITQHALSSDHLPIITTINIRHDYRLQQNRRTFTNY